jgi:hypothetical protein
MQEVSFLVTQGVHCGEKSISSDPSPAAFVQQGFWHPRHLSICQLLPHTYRGSYNYYKVCGECWWEVATTQVKVSAWHLAQGEGENAVPVHLLSALDDDTFLRLTVDFCIFLHLNDEQFFITFFLDILFLLFNCVSSSREKAPSMYCIDCSTSASYHTLTFLFLKD